LGVPGKAYGGNWNAFVFSLSMPLAAWIAVKYFIPFYRNTGEVSAYTHFEKRFGPGQGLRGYLFFAYPDGPHGLGVFWYRAEPAGAYRVSMKLIMLVMGIAIILYTVSGGIKAVIWTEVVQAIIKTWVLS
jgi:SSS family solute:Na+ symporter